jgi:hypothetical protein
VVQRVSYETCDWVEPAAQAYISLDDTKPEITEGTRFLPSPNDPNAVVEFTPSSADNQLQIDVLFNFGLNVGNVSTVVALFEQSSEYALKAVISISGTTTGFVDQAVLRHQMEAGTTEALSFSVRAGPTPAANSHLVQMNGRRGARLLGGALCSSLTITELQQ